MDVTEALDREVIIERAEAVRLWLLGMPLSSRATGAIQRELGAIIDNDPGSYINGQRPLAGLTVAAFIAELHRSDGGAVGRVKSVGYAALNELRAKIPEGAGVQRAQALPEPEYTVPELDAPQDAAPAPAAEAAPPDAAQPQPARRRGRPKGSTKAARNGAQVAAAPAVPQPTAIAEPKRGRGRPRLDSGVPASAHPLAAPATNGVAAEPKRGRGRPRRDSGTPTAASIPTAPRSRAGAAMASSAPEAREPAPAERQSAPAARAGEDLLLNQITRLWPTLHPQARRALVIYASELWADAGGER